MSSDLKKKKLESLRTSIANLETQRTLALGNKQKVDAIDKMIARFHLEVQKLKSK